jgi:hypothetical protein
MEAFLWKGRLRIISVGEKCFIKLEDGTTGKISLFLSYLLTNVLTHFNNHIRRTIRTMFI